MTVEKVFEPSTRKHRCRDEMPVYPGREQEGSLYLCTCGRYFRAVRYSRFMAFWHDYDTGWKPCSRDAAQRVIKRRGDGEPT